MNQYQIQSRACELESDREICVNSLHIGLLTKSEKQTRCENARFEYQFSSVKW